MFRCYEHRSDANKRVRRITGNVRQRVMRTRAPVHLMLDLLPVRFRANTL
jgi:hypothetical protein